LIWLKAEEKIWNFTIIGKDGDRVTSMERWGTPAKRVNV
jgi:hypothetical protein